MTGPVRARPPMWLAILGASLLGVACLSGLTGSVLFGDVPMGPLAAVLVLGSFALGVAFLVAWFVWTLLRIERS